LTGIDAPLERLPFEDALPFKWTTPFPFPLPLFNLACTPFWLSMRGEITKKY
jgi:hypothetical protein